MLVIDRLHAGARHHVVLDFGCIVQLTDVLIPQCADIMSLSIDVWTVQDDPDAQRIAFLSDISLCACVLKDLLPPPVCRFVKVNSCSFRSSCHTRELKSRRSLLHETQNLGSPLVGPL